MAEPVDLEGRDLDHEAVAAELASMGELNGAKMRRLADEFGQAIAGVDTLYVKVLLEHLVGAWELPRARLRFQRELEAGLDASIAQCIRARIEGKDLPETPGLIVEGLDREQRRRNGKG